MSNFCLKQGQGVKSSAAHLFLEFPWVPPSPPPLPQELIDIIHVVTKKGDFGRFNPVSSDFVTNSYGESWDSSCEKSWVPVQNHWVPVQKSFSPWVFCKQTVNLKTDSKTLYYSLLK